MLLNYRVNYCSYKECCNSSLDLYDCFDDNIQTDFHFFCV